MSSSFAFTKLVQKSSECYKYAVKTLPLNTPPTHLHRPCPHSKHYLRTTFESKITNPTRETSEGPDFSQYPAFIEEFTKMIVDRGLQRKWGLKSGLDGGNSYTE